MKPREKLLQFTDQGWDRFYTVVDDPYFRKKSPEMIYACLSRNMQLVPFCDYLKRFLYENSDLSQPFQDVTLDEFTDILRLAFQESAAPISFHQTSTKRSAACRNWLTQSRISRESVLLLGFGLGLDQKEVNHFLVNGLHEESLRTGDPRELICGYCFEHRYTWPKYEQLWERYEKNDWTAPANVEEAALFHTLSALKKEGFAECTQTQFSAFERLYEEALTQLAFNFNSTIRRGGPVLRQDLSSADLENVLYSAIPKDNHGNLIPARNSSLYGQFEDKRLTRQRMGALLRRETAVNRSDLITLNFYIWSQTAAEEISSKKRYLGFVDDTNEILEACGFGELYAALPYECFLMMCLLADDPYSTYLEVWESSFSEKSGTR